MEFDGFNDQDLIQPGERASKEFVYFLNSWTQLTAVINELSRAMGLADFYPFILSKRAVAKLHFIHIVIGDARQSGGEC